MSYDLLTVAAQVRESLAAEIARDLENLPDGTTTIDREDAWLVTAFWPILAQVLRDHGVDNETGDRLGWMLASLTRVESSLGWDRGYDAGRKHPAK